MGIFNTVLEERNRLVAELAKLNKALEILGSVDAPKLRKHHRLTIHQRYEHKVLGIKPKRKRGRPKGSKNKPK